MDSLKIMTFAYCDMSYRRREIIIQPGKNEEFQSLCSHDHPMTDKLFWDDLEQTWKELSNRTNWASRFQEVAEGNLCLGNFGGLNRQEKMKIGKNAESSGPGHFLGNVSPRIASRIACKTVSDTCTTTVLDKFHITLFNTPENFSSGKIALRLKEWQNITSDY